jgi:hypothetical protein
VNALESISAGHEDPLKSRGTCPGMGSHKNGLIRHGGCKSTVSVGSIRSIFQDLEVARKGPRGMPGDQIYSNLKNSDATGPSNTQKALGGDKWNGRIGTMVRNTAE